MIESPEKHLFQHFSDDFMKAKEKDLQGKLFLMRLDQILNARHPLCRLAETIDWDSFNGAFGKL